MTSPAIKLAQSVGMIGEWTPGYKQYGHFHLSVDSFIIEQALERFYVRAQAQALRDAADKLDPTDNTRRVLRRMADDLERKA